MRKPAKPRITKPNLAWKWNQRRRVWEPYHRITWTEGGKRRERAVKLDWQGSAERLDAIYWECATGRHDKQTAPAKHTWRALIETWRQDPRIQGKLSEGTKKTYRRDMDNILAKNADKDVRRTTKAAVRAAHATLAETPRKADRFLQTVSLLWNYGANKLDWPLGDNPTKGVDHYGKQREYEPWPQWMVDKLETAPEDVRTAATLILNTGQRPNAAITMKFSDFVGNWMSVLDEKNDERLEVYCPAELRDFIALAPRKGAYVLAKNLTQPRGYWAVSKAFRAWRDSLGPNAAKFVLHGLRKLAIIRLAEAGCSDAEIQAVTNQSAEMVAYYRARASRKALSRSAQQRRK